LDLRENIKVGLTNIKSNLLRTIITALIITIGIVSLVGTLTSVDGIQKSITSSMSDFGANSFDIREQGRGSRQNRRGVSQKIYPPISLKQALSFMDRFKLSGEISVHANITSFMEAKRFSKKTNPNISLTAANEHYILLKGLNLEQGRNFTQLEVQNGSNVAIIGHDLVETLFDKNEDPISQDISFYGTKYRIVGKLEKQGGLSGGGGDRRILVPLVTGNRLFTAGEPRYEISVFMDNTGEIKPAMGEATGLMRSIRKDQLGKEDSFEIKRSESLAQNLDELSGNLKMVGGIIGLITLLGAAIALMNIMLVSVTERTREIGIRKALGATPKAIQELFLIEAVVICLIGGVVGIILSIVIGNVVANLIGEGTLIIPWLWIILGFVVCVGVGLLSGLIPARKASRLDPIESLRFE